jgi:hypothetical protein
MRSTRGTRRIVVGGTEYRWRARGDDGYIVIGVWPANNVGGFILASAGYHETEIDAKKGGIRVNCAPLVVTNRLVRRVIEHAVAVHRYDPNVNAADLGVGRIEDIVGWQDAVRAVRRRPD